MAALSGHIGVPCRPRALPRNGSIKKLSNIKRKQAEREALAAQLQTVLQEASRADRARQVTGAKRQETDYLMRFLGVRRYHPAVLRDVCAFRCRLYNESRRVLALVDHLFVRYPVPFFLYRSMLSHEGLELVFEEPIRVKDTNVEPPESAFRPWFLAVARGESFAKLAKETFTKKEAHWFLLAPPTNTITANILWARAAAAGVPPDARDHLVARYDSTDLKRLGDRLPDLLRFYAESWASMRGYEHSEITDYLRAAIVDRDFSFKGRTYRSVRRLCHEWHRASYAGVVHEYRTWEAQYPFWEVQQSKYVVRAQELTNNRALSDEGVRQRHCVLTYTLRCIQGSSRIVSLRWFARASQNVTSRETSRLTVEVNPAQGTIVQIRGHLNRRATEEEMVHVRQWAGDQGLTIGRYA